MNLLPGKGAIRLPLFITRQFLYTFIFFTAIVLVLLPLSVLTYLNFYKMLIPTERILVPTKFLARGNSLQEYLKVDPLTALPFLRLNRDLSFLVRLNLHAICRTEKSYQELDYTFQMADMPRILDTLIVNCDLRYIYVEKNKWVPYNLRYWVPPIMVDIYKLVRVDWPLVYLKGSDLVLMLQQSDPSFGFKSTAPVIVDSRKTTVDFVVEWEGIRYYMVNFYVTSFLVGVGGFWIVSSWMCVVSSLVFLGYFFSDDPPIKKEEIKQEIKQEVKQEELKQD